MGIHTSDIVTLLLTISVMLLFARLFSELARAVKQPMVIGEIIAGIILGPTILGGILPSVYNYLFVNSTVTTIAIGGITHLAIVMLLLVSGLEVDLRVLISQGKVAFLISVFGIALPFGVGCIFASLFPGLLGATEGTPILIFSLFIGTALSITALPVVARTLMDLNIFKTNIGYTIIASAMFNDLAGWLIFSVILSMLGGHTSGLSVEYIIVLIFVFLIFTIFIGRKLINLTIPIVQNKASFPGGMLNFILILGFLAAAFTEYIGINAVFGAFIIGIAIGDSTHLKEETREIIQQFVTNIFAPLFFISIGLRVNFIENFDLVMVIILTSLAFLTKVVGCSSGALMGGFKKDDALVIGFGMNSGGAMGIILGLLALDVGLINEKLFVAIVIMALTTSIASAPLMSIFIKKSKQKLGLQSIIKKEMIIFSSAANKIELIHELANLISQKKKINKKIIIDAVIQREEQMPTGLGSYLALPHARIKLPEPVIAIAISKNGIDFNAPDEIPSKIIFMLLTPEDDTQIQLKLLAEISQKFTNHEKVTKYVSSTSTEELLANFFED
ncbi:MAG: cation:proton antiporter [bacterium]